MDTIIFTTLAAATPGAAPAWVSLLPLVLIFIIFYFLLIRPQQKRMKQHQEKISAVKRGDQVVTGGGLMGKVIKADDDYVEIDLGGGTKVKAVKSTLADIVPPGGKAAND
ncbi:MAG: preprotein translocase subunit YajC [Pseudomonadota bacterium]